MAGVLAAQLELKRPAIVGEGWPRVNLIAASRQGDVLALTADAILYGFVGRPSLLAACDTQLSYELRQAEFNNCADCVLVVGVQYLAVGRLPPRAADGGAALAQDDSLKPWAWTVLVAGETIIQAKWHAYADDHCVGLEPNGRLRLWDCASLNGSQACAEAHPPHRMVGSARALCFGGSNGWARFAVLVLAEEELLVACPLAPRRCALTAASAMGMARWCRRRSWTNALDWLERAAPRLALLEKGDDFFVTLTTRGLVEVDARIAAALAVDRGRRKAELIANAMPDLQDGLWALVAIAYEDGLLELGLVAEASRPTLDDDSDDLPAVTPFAVLDSLLVSPPQTEPRALWLAEQQTFLCYATSTGVAFIHVGWLESLDKTLAAGAVAPSDRASCRHVVSQPDHAAPCVVGIASTADTLLIWFEDSAAASVSLSASRFYAKLLDATYSTEPPNEHTDMLPRLADQLGSAILKARTELATPVSRPARRAEADAIVDLVEARAELESVVLLPLAEAAPRIKALTSLLSVARDEQLTKLQRAVATAAKARTRLEKLSQLAEACADRAASLAVRAKAVQQTAHHLQPNLSKADKAYRADLEALAATVGRFERATQAAAIRTAKIAQEDPKNDASRLSLSDQHVDLCHQLLQGQMALLQKSNADILHLHHQISDLRRRAAEADYTRFTFDHTDAATTPATQSSS